MTKASLLHRILRGGQQLAILGFATAASALADGSGTGSLPFSVGPAFANEVEAALVHAIVGLRDSGLNKAMGEIDKALDTVKNSLAKVDANDLNKTYPIQFQNEDVSTEYVLNYLLGHFNYHLGQIDYHRRLLVGE